jgi:hypothetical protein
VRPLWAFLSLVSLIAIVVLVWRSPETRDRISSVILGQPLTYSPPAEELAEKPAEKPAAKRSVVKVRRTAASAPAPDPIPQAVVPTSAPVGAPLRAKATPAPTRRFVEIVPSEVNVKSDSAAVYSFNSPRSPVVRVLRKGDKVETNIEVIDSGGRWSLIQAEQFRSGFVRSENLERSQVAIRN